MKRHLIILIVLAVLSLLGAPFLGESLILMTDPDGLDGLVFWEVRVPRVF